MTRNLSNDELSHIAAVGSTNPRHTRALAEELLDRRQKQAQLDHLREDLQPRGKPASNGATYQRATPPKIAHEVRIETLDLAPAAAAVTIAALLRDGWRLLGCCNCKVQGNRGVQDGLYCVFERPYAVEEKAEPKQAQAGEPTLPEMLGVLDNLRRSVAQAYAQGLAVSFSEEQNGDGAVFALSIGGGKEEELPGAGDLFAAFMERQDCGQPQ